MAMSKTSKQIKISCGNYQIIIDKHRLPIRLRQLAISKQIGNDDHGYRDQVMAGRISLFLRRRDPALDLSRPL
jgi:hypothetical protein